MPNQTSSYLRVDKLQKAEDRIKINKWDVEAWSVLLRSAQCKRIEEAREIYERIMKAQNYESVEKLFQRCLVKIHHIDLWKLYIQYIKETKAKHPNFNQVTGSYAESQKITATRRVYQRAIVTPMSGIETIWRDYCQYESSINPAIAKKFTEDRSKEHNNAKRVTKEYEAVTKGLSKNMPSVPPQNTPYEVKQVELWKRYIQWEKDNPLKTEDLIVITKRVMFAYEQCLLCLGHHPDIWYEAATYLEQATKQLSDKGDLAMSRQFADETALMYERAIALLSDNMMLYFAYADYEENRGKFNKVHSIYKKLISLKEIDPTLPYIQYMRSTRRCEGISAARIVFKSSREDQRVNYQVFVAAAYMEYFCTKDKGIAHRIFELGMKRFSSNADFISAYLDFMSILNEDNNTRVLFERSLGSSSQVAQEKTCHVWSRFLQFELQVGDLSSILKVERRRLEIINKIKKECKGKETALLIDRYRFLDLFPCTESELRSLGYRDLVKFGITGSANIDLISHEELHVGNNTTDETHNQYSSRTKGTYPKPDVTQMLPYKPKAYPRTGSHVVSGGEFPPPPAASALLKIMPPPECFSGPFVQIDKFMEHFLGLELSDDYLWGITCESEELANNIDPGTALSIEMAASNSILLKSTLANSNSANNNAGEKRQASVIARSLNAYGDSEDDEEDSDEDEDAENGEGSGGVASGSDPNGSMNNKTSSWKSMRQEALLMKAPVASNPGFLDLFRLRNAKKKLKANT